MKVYPKYPKDFYVNTWMQAQAEKERQKLSQFCECKSHSDKYGTCFYFEFSGSLEDFYKKYGDSFITFTDTEKKMAICLKMNETF